MCVQFCLRETVQTSGNICSKKCTLLKPDEPLNMLFVSSMIYYGIKLNLISTSSCNLIYYGIVTIPRYTSIP